MNRWWWEIYDQMLRLKGPKLREDGTEGEEPYLATLVARRPSHVEMERDSPAYSIDMDIRPNMH